MMLIRIAAALATSLALFVELPTTAPAEVYGKCAPSADGIGKTYMGREIAQVMGHEAADWLDRPEREEEEAPKMLVEIMQLRPTDVVADIGAGSGHLAFLGDPAPNHRWDSARQSDS